MEVIFTFYNVVISVLIVIWLFFFFYKKELRKEMLILGIFGIFLFPTMLTVGSTNTDEIIWRFTQINIFDFLFIFSLAGISGTIFHVIFGKHYHQLPYRLHRKFEKKIGIAEYWITRIFLMMVLFIWSVVLMNFFFDIALPTATLISSIIFAVYMVSHRHDLLMDCIWSAMLTTTIVFLASNFALLIDDIDYGITPIITDLTFLSIPLDLLVWSLGFGFILGPIYEYIRRFELDK